MRIHQGKKAIHKITLVLLATVISWTLSSPTWAQKEKKKKQDTAAARESNKAPAGLSDDQQVDYLLAEMLGAWQLGDTEKLHKAYADDVSMVNGGWAAPIVGWTNYLAIYQQQIARMQKLRMDRFNTYIKVSGTVAWACYQWEFEAVVDGAPAASQGQTTVILQKRDGRWVIVHNHTSLVQSLTPGSGNTTPVNQPPAKPQGD
jgi:ketosteroid isomerase-like protein